MSLNALFVVFSWPHFGFVALAAQHFFFSFFAELEYGVLGINGLFAVRV
jgi:hypothetical protein